MTPTQKLIIAEKMPFGLLVFASTMYFVCEFSGYLLLYDYLDQIINCCLTFCFFAWLVSDSWSFVAKRSIIGLVLLNVLDLFYTRIDIDLYFHLYKLVILYIMSFIFIFYFYAHTNSKSH